jgi:hypothetical protein
VVLSVYLGFSWQRPNKPSILFDSLMRSMRRGRRRQAQSTESYSSQSETEEEEQDEMEDVTKTRGQAELQVLSLERDQ